MKFLIIASIWFMLLPLVGYADPQPNKTEPSSTLQISLEKDFQGNPVSMLIDAKGKKANLTLGTLLQATAESWMSGPLPSPPVASNTIAVIRIYKQDGKLIPYIEDDKGSLKTLDLGSLISGTAENYPGCTAAQINGKSLILNLIFKTDNTGHISTFYVGTQGEERFNLGTLVRDTTILLNQCKGHDIN